MNIPLRPSRTPTWFWLLRFWTWLPQLFWGSSDTQQRTLWVIVKRWGYALYRFGWPVVRWFPQSSAGRLILDGVLAMTARLALNVAASHAAAHAAASPLHTSTVATSLPFDVWVIGSMLLVGGFFIGVGAAGLRYAPTKVTRQLPATQPSPHRW